MQPELFQRLRSGFHTELASNDLILYVLLFLGLLLLGLMIARLVLRPAQPARVKRRDYLIEALRRLGLPRDERQLLKSLAARAALPQPAAMLLSPANLAYAFRRLPPEHRNAALYQRLNEIARGLYDKSLPEPPP